MTCRVLVSWSSGKDSAWMLHELRQKEEFEIIGLLTTFNAEFNRVAMHAVRQSLIKSQAAAVDLPLFEVPLPWPCKNEDYEKAMRHAFDRARADHGITHVAYGDLFLDDVRRYREDFMRPLEIDPLFPIWGKATDRLATTMVNSGLRAYVTCIDPKKLPASFAGRIFDDQFLRDLPADVDPCGENGEFHTFACKGPMFNETIEVVTGETIERDGFIFTDLIAAAN